MKKFVLSVVALAALAIVAAPAMAQPGGGRFGGGMSGAMLLSQKSVQEELKLSDDQIKKVEELGQKMRSSFGNLQGLSREELQKKFEDMRKENDKAVSEILKPEQQKRLKEITFQLQMRQGMGAVLANQDIVKDLNLSDEQKEKLDAIRKDGQRFREELGIQPGQRPTEEQQKKMADFRKSNDEKISKVLTEDQRAKLKTMGGAEFKGEIRIGRPGGAGGAR